MAKKELKAVRVVSQDKNRRANDSSQEATNAIDGNEKHN